MNAEQREQRYRYGLQSMDNLLREHRFVDVQVKRATRDEWVMQFARFYTGDTWHKGMQHRNKQPAWEEHWIPVEKYPELWTIFRERICEQTTLSHAGIGDIINSKGENLNSTAAGPVHQTSANKKKSRVETTVDNFESVKQEEVLPSIGQENVHIDLTDWPSPSTIPEQENYEANDCISETHESEYPTRHPDSNVIDLTEDVVIVIDDDDLPVPSDIHPTGMGLGQGVQGRSSSMQQDESDDDSLFDGPDLEEDRESHKNDGNILWHLPPDDPQYSSQNAGASRPMDLIVTPTISVPPLIKKGQKRALDFDEDTQEQSRKKRSGSRVTPMPSLLTAERGKVVERRRDGEYRIFNAQSSAGSALAAKMAQKHEESDIKSYSQPSNKPVVADPADLEDYEDEDEPLKQEASTITDPQIQAMYDKWSQVEKPRSSYDSVSHLLTTGSSRSTLEPNAPPLFLLAINKETTLRLTARNCSQAYPQWYLADAVKKEEETYDTDDCDMIYPVDMIWRQHKAHLPDLLPQYHDLVWRKSLKRQEELRVEINRAELRRDVETTRRLEEQMRTELASSWRLGERERTCVIPRVADIVSAESILFTTDDGKQVISLNDPAKRMVGGWAELVLFRHGSEIPGEHEHETYETLARTLEKQEKFLVISYGMVDEHNKNPHTLLIFASRSRTIGELCGLPEDMMRRRKSLVVVHVGRSLSTSNLPVFNL
ncbi:hypothetical protein M408DRAFT_329136, partial [Serendipita vermifera MAFF 305830]